MARHKALRRLSISIDNHIHSPSARGRVMRGIHIVVLAATILFLGPASSQAQDMSPLEPEAMPRAHASEVLVSATRTERELFDVPSSAAIVTSRQMEMQPKGTIAEQLQDIPGIQVTDGGMGGGAKRITIRGEAASRVLVLIDGMKISEQKSMDGSMLLIDPINIERIEVIKGPASVLYGSEAIGGVVNIITKKGGTKPVQASFVTQFDGSANAPLVGGAIYGGYKGFGYRVTGDYTEAKDKRGGSGRIDNSSYMQRNISTYLDYSWGTGRVGGGYDHFWTNTNIPSATSDGATVSLDLPEWKRERFYLFGEVDQISDYLQKINLTGFTQLVQKEFSNQIDVTMVQTPMMTMERSMLLDTYNKQRSYGATFQTDWTFGDSHYVVAGVDFLRDKLDATDDREAYMIMTNMAGTTVISDASGFGNYRYEGHQDTWAVFVQDEWSFAQDWTATIGLRQTWVRSSLDDTDNPDLATESSSDSHMVGSIGLVYAGFEDWRLRAQYAQGYRYPSLQQLYIGTVHGSSNRTYPNPDLNPETSHNVELGARYNADGLNADFAVYYNWADEYIFTPQKTINGASARLYENGNSAETFGAELELSYKFESWGLTPYLSGTFMHREIDRGSNGGKTTKTGNPNWYGRAGLRFERELTPILSFHADAYARMAAHSEEKATDGEVTKHGGWATANLAFGVRLGEEKNYFVDLNLNNLTNKRYTPAASSLEDPGFHAVLRLGVEF